jgi:Uma2 family endonuclease
MGAVTTAPVSAEEYLANPAYEHSEWVAGGVVPLNVGSKKHARIQGRCFRALDEYFDTRDGFVGTELHCRLEIRGETHFRLPDVAVVLGDFSGKYLERATDLAIEIKSPEDSVTALIRKSGEYFANGSKTAWIILPEEESVLILTPDGPPRTAVRSENLSGDNLLAGLNIPVDDLFK